MHTTGQTPRGAADDRRTRWTEPAPLFTMHVVRELLLVLGIVAVLMAGSALFLVPWMPLAKAGGALLLFGLVFGVPAGLWYHVLLHRALAPRGELPRGWIWHPLRLHDRLRPPERPRVLAYCYAGAAGFISICMGLWLVTTALVSAYLQT